jgi:hypothetical protein
MYPEGHARSQSGNLDKLLAAKFHALAGPAVADAADLHERLSNLCDKPPEFIQRIYDFWPLEH